TGEGNILRSVGTGAGVYMSSDGAKTFKHVSLRDTRHISRIVIHPRNPDIVYVAALGHAWGPNPERGVFKTTDAGKTWDKVLFVDDTTGATDLAIDPADPNILYACAYTFRRDAFSGTAPRPQFGDKAGIYKTDDGGKTWARLTQGLPASKLGRCGVDVYRKDPNTVFAIMQTERSGGGGGKFGKGSKGGKGGGKEEGKGEGKDDVDAGGVFRSDDKGK